MKAYRCTHFDPNDEVIGILYVSLLEDVLQNYGRSIKGSRVCIRTASHEKRISYSEMNHILKASLERAPAGIGFDYGRLLNPIAADTLGQLLMSSNVLMDVINYVRQFHVLLGLSLEFELNCKSDNASVRFDSLYRRRLPDYMQWFASESLFICCLNVGSWLTGKPIKLTKLRLPYAEPEHVDLYLKHFGDVLEFDAECHEMVFPKEYLDLPVLTANEPVRLNKLRHCKKIKSKWESRMAVTDRVKMIFSQTYPQFPSLDCLAQRLNMSRSCLYRKLQKNRTSYQALVNDFKRDESIFLLKESWLSVSEVADRMGFSDVSSFRRAFKNWTGAQPSSVRRSDSN